MEEKFVNSFMTRLYEKLPDKYLEVIRNQLFVHMYDYDVSEKCTDVIPYVGYIPDCLKVYLVTSKIEGKSDGTLEYYANYLNNFFETVRKPIEQITTNDIRIFLYNYKKDRNVSDTTVEQMRTIINTFFNWCVNENYIAKNVCKPIKPIRYERKERNPLSDIELEYVRNACNSYRDAAIIEMFYSTGCRVSELTGLKKSDVNFEKKEVYLFGKGKKHRTSYLNAKAEVALKKYLFTRTDESDYLFVSIRKPHDKLGKQAVEKIVRDIGNRSQLNRSLFPHLIRHSTATNGLARGMSIPEVQMLLGHENVNTTMIYAKVADTDIKTRHHKCIV